MKAIRAASFLLCAMSVLALMDPRIAALGTAAAAACLATLIALARNGERMSLVPSLVGIFCGLIGATGYNTGADTPNYLGNVASLLQDFDFDQANQLTSWGYAAAERGPGGMSITEHPVGNAFLWAIPGAFAHGYALMSGAYAPNFATPPYFGAFIATNLAIALSGAMALLRLLERHTGGPAAALAVGASIFASPILFYLTRQPMMAHGLTYGLSCWSIVAAERAARTDSNRDWAMAGATVGLAMACRFQAVVLFALVAFAAPLEIRNLSRRLAFALPPAIVLFVPQMIVWLKTFGKLLVIPQGPGFLKTGSPHWIDTLFSADRGLFNWHPTLFFGFVGLLLFRGEPRALARCGVVIFAATAALNGAAADFNGSDAFGARRYDLVVPFLGIGLARLLAWARPLLAARPLLLPATALAFAALWNGSFVDYYGRQIKGAAPLEDLAAVQVRGFRQKLDSAVRWMGPRARYRVYDAFVGQYTYRNFRPGGDFDLATLEARLLRQGWSDATTNGDWPVFRYAFYPRACLAVPIEEPFDLRGVLVARAPARIDDQRIRIVLNGHALSEASLPAQWTDIAFDAPKAAWVPGENLFCFEFSKKRPGDEGDDVSPAAAVVRLQFP